MYFADKQLAAAHWENPFDNKDIFGTKLLYMLWFNFCLGSNNYFTTSLSF